MRTRAVLLVALLIVAAAVGGLLLTRRGPAATDVEITAVTRESNLQSFVTASGEITAGRSADIGSSLMGRLVSLRVREGDRVEAGQLLAIIDPEQAASSTAAASAAVEALEADARAATASVRVAEADHEAARTRQADTARTLARTRELHDQGLVAQQALDAAVAAADQAQSQVAAAVAALRRAEQATESAQRRITQARADERGARDTLSKTRITAPIAGVVTRLDVEEGEMVVVGVQNQAGTILMTISDLSAIDAEVKVAEADVLRLAENDRARVTLESLPDASFSGRVVEIGASALPQVGAQAAAREFKVLIRLDTPERQLRPGLTCDVEILVDERENALVVPLQSIVERTVGGTARTGVFIERDGMAVFTPLSKTGIIGGLRIEVEGLAEGARVVAGPLQALRELTDGARVRVTGTTP